MALTRIPGHAHDGGPDARWVVARYPVDRVEGPDDDGWVTATLALASEPGVTRPLVRLGAQAQVTEPSEWRVAARRATERVLARYRRS